MKKIFPLKAYPRQTKRKLWTLSRKNRMEMISFPITRRATREGILLFIFPVWEIQNTLKV